MSPARRFLRNESCKIRRKHPSDITFWLIGFADGWFQTLNSSVKRVVMSITGGHGVTSENATRSDKRSRHHEKHIDIGDTRPLPRPRLFAFHGICKLARLTRCDKSNMTFKGNAARCKKFRGEICVSVLQNHVCISYESWNVKLESLHVDVGSAKLVMFEAEFWKRIGKFDVWGFFIR